MAHVKWTAVLVLVLGWCLVGCGGDSGSIPGGAKGVKVKSLKKMSLDCGNKVKIDFLLIPKGKFQMGSTGSEQGHEDREGPRHEVSMTKPFYMSVYEVTQKQYESVLGENPSYTKGPDHPVDNVFWKDAQRFCSKLSEKSGRHVRLPTEAEWEYACRAGTDTSYPWGDSPADMGMYATYKDNNAGVNVTEPVGKKMPNPWGLYDMIGNVWEFVQDNDSSKYDTNDNVNPAGNPSDIGLKIGRGGSMIGDPAHQCRPAYRMAIGIGIKLFDCGFRVVCDE